MTRRLLLISMVISALAVVAGGCAGPPVQKWPRVGVIEIPPETAPRELWEAVQIWKDASQYVTIVASLTNGVMYATYSLNIGFEPQNYKTLRQRFHKKLLGLGWKFSDTPSEQGGSLYMLEGRKLSVGYDMGYHPTTLLIRYELAGEGKK